MLAALDSLGKYQGMFKPDQAVVIPVTFQFLNGPSPDTGTVATVLDVSPKPLASPDTGMLSVPALGKPERG